MSVNRKPNCFYKLLHYNSYGHNYSTRQVVIECYTVPMPKYNAVKKPVMYRPWSIWNSDPPTVIEISKFQFNNVQ